MSLCWNAEKNENSSKIKCYPAEPVQHFDNFPSWFDKNRFYKSKTILSRHFFSILFAHLSGLILLVFIQSIYRTLSTSGKSGNLVSLFYRYASTLLTIKSWYEEDVLDPKNRAFHSLQRVKQMHFHTSSWQNKDKVQTKNEMSISMRDMLLTQFSFVGLIVLYPKRIGFSNKEKDIDEIVYFWRCIGYLLDMPDEYNLCTGSIEQVRQRSKEVFELNFRPNLIRAEEQGERMSNDIIYTAQQYIYFLRYNSHIKYLYEIMSIENSIKLETYMEKFTYICMRNVMSHWIHYRLVAIILNTIVRFSVWRLRIKFFTDNIVNNLSYYEKRRNL